MSMNSSLVCQTSSITFAVLFFWVTSISMVFANKALLGDESFASAPMFITWTHCVVTVLFCFVAGPSGIGGIPQFEIRQDVLAQTFVLSLCFSAMLACNNLCLKYVEVSFYQVVRSLTVLFNVVLDYLVLGHATSPKAILCCGVVVFGFALGNAEEVHWSLPGFMYGLMSSFFVAMNAILVKRCLELVDNDPWKIALYTNTHASFILAPIFILSGKLTVLHTSTLLRNPLYCALLVGSGLLGVFLSIATTTQIKHTSPLTHNVSATGKAVVQTVLALVVFKNPINLLGALSVLLVLTASLMYTRVRQSEMKLGIAKPVGSVVSEKRPLLKSETNKLPR